jgi:alpha-L-rhamnosidase
MNMKPCLLALATSLIHPALAGAADDFKIAIVKPRCEYLSNPEAVDVARPRLSWVLETSDAGRRGVRQAAYQITAATSRAALLDGKADLWDSGVVRSSETNQIEYAGKTLAHGQECWWQVKVLGPKDGFIAISQPARWTAGLGGAENWKAGWIGIKVPPVETKSGTPAAFLRSEFQLSKPVRRARVYATALGNYELHLNGRKVGRDHFTPGYTDYRKTLYYNAYDVTEQLQQGPNAIGAMLADGWYAGAIGWKGNRHVFGGQPLFSAMLEIEHEDGTRQRIATGPDWQGAFGPILEADHLMGCVYDARKEMPGWDRAGFSSSGWQPVITGSMPNVRFSAYPSEPVREMQELKTIAVTTPKPDVHVFDLGQNMVGWARLKITGTAGQKVVLRFAEMLNDDGTVYTANLRSARATDTFFLKGGGEEILEPAFTFHGFRYVEVTGLPAGVKPDASMITGIVVHSGIASTSSFECSHPMVNQLYSNIVWGMRGNYLDIPTDCPQRDERMGWMGDAQAFIRTGACLMDIAPFFTKWMVDVEDAQGADGMFTDVAPRGILDSGGVAGWADAGVICPWTIYQVYGDKRILEKHYAAMARWIEYMRATSKDLIRPDHGYGDWLAPFAANNEGDTPKPLLGTAYFAYSTGIMAKAARVLGKNEDADSYDALAADVRAAFNKAFVSPDGTLAGDTQTAYLMALRFHLVPDALRPKLEERLVARIQERDWHLSTGFLGVNLLIPTLTDIGRVDVAYRLLENTSYPSWGYSIVNGATTIWERWNSYTKDKGFGDVGMNSFNHYAYGSVGEWMFSSLAGIDTDGPGFRKMIIHPRPGGSVNHAKAEYDSINGRIRTAWETKGTAFTLKASIPCNTTATVHIPTANAEAVMEGGKPTSGAPGVKYLRMEQGKAVFEIGSGNYDFRVE